MNKNNSPNILEQKETINIKDKTFMFRNKNPR